MKLLLAAILVVFCVLLVDSGLLEGSLEHQANVYRVQNGIVYAQLVKECPGLLISRRDIPTEFQPLDLQIQKQLYEHLLKELYECRKLKLTSSTKSTATTKVKPTTTAITEHPTTTNKVKSTTAPTTVHPTTTNKVKSTTTTNPQPIECQQATNYTQSWRRDYNGSNIRPGGPNSFLGSACDLHVSNTEWFRFTGEAGNRMLDRCPKKYSCGTGVPQWTDAEMPKVVGVESTVDLYAVRGNDCKYYTRQVKVMRCSRDTEHDFIYKQTTNLPGTCAQAFCGMM